jgi:acyl-CoA synthetase (AMP-forming)/AMP-acid ligase II/acyl carrier protein
MSVFAGIPSRTVSSFVDILRLRAEEQPEALAYRFLISGDSEGPVEECNYFHLDRYARSVAAHLYENGAIPGDRALLLYPAGLEFIAAFLGSLYAGVIAVPAYPHRTLLRLEGIAQNAECRFVLTSSAFLKLSRSLAQQAPALKSAKWLATSEILNEPAPDWKPLLIDEHSPAFLQYTSGSTGDPKGVVVSHGNILHNESLIQRGFATDPAMHVVGWLPLYHDMGLIGNLLQPLFVGASCTFMSSMAFLQRPLRWLRAISRFQGTVSGGPNFAFDLCVSKLTPGEHLDLSSWRIAFNGSEPVRKDTLSCFTAAFAPFGFRPEAFLSCYGLAEATLFVSGTRPGQAPESRSYSAESLDRNRAVESCQAEAGSRTLVSAGESQPELEVLIVDPRSRVPCAQGEIGEIWISGPSVAKGYWNEPALTNDIFVARPADGSNATRQYLRTGDLGFISKGQLFVTGRLKDLIILQGRNLYPQDIEATVQMSHSAIRAGACVAFSLEVGGEEKLIVLAEIPPRLAERQQILQVIRAAVLEEYGVAVHIIALLPPKTIPKTSSGKLQRNACRKSFAAGELPVLMVSSLDQQPVSTAGYVAPGTELEQRLVAIWQCTLAMERVGIEDDFFQIGGHSVLAIQMLAQISDEIGVEVSIRQLFEAPTIKKLAEVISNSDGASGAGKKNVSQIKKLARPAAVLRN